MVTLEGQLSLIKNYDAEAKQRIDELRKHSYLIEQKEVCTHTLASSTLIFIIYLHNISERTGRVDGQNAPIQVG